IWERFREALEALGVDPYSPAMPEDDPRFLKVQSVLAEYKTALSGREDYIPGWEGHSPLNPINTLDGLADWLSFEWKSVLFSEVGGTRYMPAALARASRTLR